MIKYNSYYYGNRGKFKNTTKKKELSAYIILYALDVVTIIKMFI